MAWNVSLLAGALMRPVMSEQMFFQVGLFRTVFCSGMENWCEWRFHAPTEMSMNSFLSIKSSSTCNKALNIKALPAADCTYDAAAVP